MLTDNQMMLLEQLTYIDESVAESAGIKYTGAADVKEMLNVYTEDVLKELERQPADGNMTYGYEYAAIIRAIKSDPDLMNLKLTAYNKEEGIFCYEDPSNPNEAVVAFCGTRGGEEWKDNFDGLTETDTLHQRRALDFVEGLPYDNISVVGHSKGGNKAQYVTILSDKVDRCVSMDGQGFSNEFIEKYSYEISQKADQITNYSIDTDYVHILLVSVPGSNQIYCEGDPNQAGLKNHAPCMYYSFYIDENGDYQLALDKNGEPIIRSFDVKENEMMTYLQKFTVFISNEMPDDVKMRVAEYLGNLMALTRGSNYHVEVDGVVYTKDNLIEYLLSDLESAEIFIAYLLKYVDTYGLTIDQLKQLLDAFGIDTEIVDVVVDVLGVFGISSEDEVLGWLINQLSDGKKDVIINTILSLINIRINSWLSKKAGKKIEVDINSIWSGVESKYGEIGEIENPKESITPKGITVGNAMDFTEKTYMLIRDVITRKIRQDFPVLDWSAYQDEEWYINCGCDSNKKAIESIERYIDRIERENLKRVEIVFSHEYDIDANDAGKLNELCNDIRRIGIHISQLV